LASYFTNGLLISNEVIKQRASVLVENTTKWGSDNIIVTNNDPKDFKKLSGFFDVIVIDAPCSSSGLFRKDKNAIDEWSEDNVNLCSQRQKRIITDTIECLNDGGLLIYSTCSYSKQENENILDWAKENFDLESVQISLEDDWGIVETLSDLHNAFGYRFYPDQVKGEGFFIAAFKKNDSDAALVKFKETNLTKLSKGELEIANDFGRLNANSYLFKQNEFIRVFPNQFQRELQIIASYLYIKKAGVELGVVKGKDLIPSHELALSSIDISHLPFFDLNKEQSLQYLGKKEVNIDINSKGWALVKFEGAVLGWIKALQNRINNYYPSEWRILKDNLNK
jgi:NOL1/NOP2/fmu family ribosome biogenesis protein